MKKLEGDNVSGSNSNSGQGQVGKWKRHGQGVGSALQLVPNAAAGSGDDQRDGLQR
jgi:hypothetical protein